MSMSVCSCFRRKSLLTLLILSDKASSSHFLSLFDDMVIGLEFFCSGLGLPS